MSPPKTKGSESGPEDPVGINWISCDKCSCWDIHENTGIPGPYKEKAMKKMKYTCRVCKLTNTVDCLAAELRDMTRQFTSADVSKWSEVVQRIPQELQAAKQSVVKFMDDNSLLLQTEMAQAKTSIQANLPDNINHTLSAPQLRQAAKEVQDVEARKFNIIVSGMAEGREDEEEFITFCNLFHNTAVPLSRTDIVMVERLGRQGNSKFHRLLRIKLKTQETRRNLLNIHKLRNGDDGPEIYIRPDLTSAQQEFDKQLRNELKSKGKDKFCIFRGKIVPRENVYLDSKATVIHSGGTHTLTPNDNLINHGAIPKKNSSTYNPGHGAHLYTSNNRTDKKNYSSNKANQPSANTSSFHSPVPHVSSVNHGTILKKSASSNPVHGTRLHTSNNRTVKRIESSNKFNQSPASNEAVKSLNLPSYRSKAESTPVNDESKVVPSSHVTKQLPSLKSTEPSS